MGEKTELLEQVKDFILDKFNLREIKAIILVGSYATGRQQVYSDIDIVIFKKNQKIPVERLENRFKDYDLDIWLYNQNYLMDAFQREITSPNDLGEISLFLRFFREAVIWYQEDEFLDKYIDSSIKWEWKYEVELLIDFPIQIPKEKWAKNALDEHLSLLKNVKNCIGEGKPISHRIKDYPELITDFEEEIAKRLMEITAKAYSDLGIKREWTEYKDAKKALQYQEWGLAVASLKDVLKFLIRSSLESPPNQLLDPNIWCLAEEADLPTNLKRALEFIYDQSFSS